MGGKSGQMDLVMRGTGEVTKLMALGDSTTLTEIYMKGNGLMIRHMEMVFTHTPMEPNIRDSGKRTSNTAME